MTYSTAGHIGNLLFVQRDPSGSVVDNDLASVDSVAIINLGHLITLHACNKLVNL